MERRVIRKIAGRPPGFGGWRRLLMFVGAAGWLARAGWGAAPEPPGGEVVTIRQYYALPLEQARMGRPVRLKCVVLNADKGWNQLHFSDGDQTLFLDPSRFTNEFAIGQSVEITGVTAVSDGNYYLTNLAFAPRGRAPLPAARRLEIPQLAGDYGQWVETSGRVRVAETSKGRLGLTLHDRDRSCLVYVMGTPPTNDVRSWFDCAVRIRGINTSQVVDGRLIAATLGAPRVEEITILERPSQNPLATPVEPVGGLSARDSGPGAGRRVHVSGLVADFKAGEYLIVEDATGTIRAQITQAAFTPRGARVNLWGYLTALPTGVELADAYFELISPPAANAGPTAAAPAVARASAPIAPALVGREIANFAQFYALTREQAQQGQPVRITGVVIGYDGGWNQLFVDDGFQTMYFDPRVFNIKPAVGQRVEITGRTATAGQNYILTNLDLSILGPALLPPAKPLELSQLGGDYGQWIETVGRVRVVETSKGRLVMVVHDQGRSCVVTVMGAPRAGDFNEFLDCRVRIRGINNSRSVNGQLEQGQVFAPGFDEITILERPALNPLEEPVIAIGSLLGRELGSWTNNRVHINGVVSSSRLGESLVVKDPTGTIRARVVQVTEAAADQRVNVWGFIRASSGGVELEDAYFEHAQPPPQTLADAPPAGALSPWAGQTGALTNIADVLRLGRDDAAMGKPVRLRGVITYADTEWQTAFLQDRGGAIYLKLNQREIRPRQLVELAGRTGAGGFTPEIIVSEIQVLGVGEAPPSPMVDLEDVANGRMDAHWVEMEGVVQRIEQRQWGHLRLSVMTPKGRFNVVIPDHFNAPAPTQLLDALVSIQGVCGVELNLRRQFSGVTLYAPNLDQVNVLEPAPPDPFAVHATPIAAVATFDPDHLAGRRVKIHGTVTLSAPGEGFFVQDASGGMRVQTRQTNEAQIGDAVDVLGFPVVGDYSPGFEEAEFRVTPGGPPPVVAPATADQIMARGTNDNCLVRLEARLLQSVPRAARPELVLQDGAIVFTAQLATPVTGRWPADYRPGSLLRLTGVASIQGDQRHEPKSFRLLLRRPADLELLATPPWWTWARASWALGAMLLIALAAAGWGLTLREQVRLKSELIRQKLEREAALEERFRVLVNNANDIVYTHDLNGRINSLNQAGEEFFGCPRERWLGMNVADLLAPGEWERARAMMERKMVGGGRTTYEIEVLAADGSRRALEVSTWLVQRDDRSVEVQGIGRDVTERKRALAEKELLLKEIHHRVKNNMQVVSSLLTLQSGQTKDPKIIALFRQSENRVKSMALIHEKLYKSADFARVEFLEYTRSLIQMISAAHGAGARVIQTALEIQPVSLGIDTAIPVGLILNELVSNAYKHAFNDRTDGVISVTFYAADDQVVLTVRDNGTGLPEGFDIDESQTLGMRLVKILTKQIGGTLAVRRDGGAEFSVSFPLARTRQAA